MGVAFTLSSSSCAAFTTTTAQQCNPAVTGNIAASEDNDYKVLALSAGISVAIALLTVLFHFPHKLEREAAKKRDDMNSRNPVLGRYLTIIKQHVSTFR